MTKHFTQIGKCRERPLRLDTSGAEAARLDPGADPEVNPKVGDIVESLIVGEAHLINAIQAERLGNPIEVDQQLIKAEKALLLAAARAEIRQRHGEPTDPTPFALVAMLEAHMAELGVLGHEKRLRSNPAERKRLRLERADHYLDYAAHALASTETPPLRHVLPVVIAATGVRLIKNGDAANEWIHDVTSKLNGSTPRR